MTAQVAANLPFDPAPPPARSQVPAASSFQFLNLISPPRTASTNHLSAPTGDGPSGTATARVTTTSSTPRATGGQNSNGDQGNAQQNNSNQRDAASADGAARVMMVPVPIPPQPVPQPAGAVSAGATVALAGTPAAPQPIPSSPADAAALLLLAANTLAAADATQPAAAGAPATGTSATTLTATAGQTALPGQVLPSMVANLSMRLAASALTLVSQPRVTLASATPEITAPTKPDASATELAALDRQALLTDAAHGSSKPGASATTGGLDELLAAAAKDAVGAASQLTHSPTADQGAATPSQTGGTAGSATIPQIATMTPAPLTLANELPVAMQIAPHVVAEQVALTLRQAVSSGSDHIQIQLQPADLGAVDVKLSINHDGRVTMVVSADRSDTLNLLQQDAGTLAQALRDAGLQADSSSLSFNLRGGYQFNQQQGGLAGAPLVDDISAGGIDGNDTAPTATLRAHAGSLDIHV